MVPMEMSLTSSPTPPLPTRHPDHRWGHSPLHMNHTIDSRSSLTPKPLFHTKPRSHRPEAIYVTVRDLLPIPPSSPMLSYDSNTSLQSYFSSFTSPSSPSPSPSPSLRRSILKSPFQPLDSSIRGDGWTDVETTHVPKQSLRRRSSPRNETLRSLRIKESDACLQRVYDERLEAFLSGGLFRQTRWGLRVVMEEGE